MTPLHMVGTIERKDRCDICFGKVAFKRKLLVPEAYWYKLSIFCSLHTICLDWPMLYATCVYTCKIINKVFESFVQISWEKNMRNDQGKCCLVP